MSVLLLLSLGVLVLGLLDAEYGVLKFGWAGGGDMADGDVPTMMGGCFSANCDWPVRSSALSIVAKGVLLVPKSPSSAVEASSPFVFRLNPREKNDAVLLTPLAGAPASLPGL